MEFVAQGRPIPTGLDTADFVLRPLTLAVAELDHRAYTAHSYSCGGSVDAGLGAVSYVMKYVLFSIAGTRAEAHD